MFYGFVRNISLKQFKYNIGIEAKNKFYIVKKIVKKV